MTINKLLRWLTGGRIKRHEIDRLQVHVRRVIVIVVVVVVAQRPWFQNTPACILNAVIIFTALGSKDPRAKNIKLKSIVGMARGPVLHQQKQSSRVLRKN